MSEYETEPVPGLPAHLPAGERLLWQGAPRWTSLARCAFHLRKLAVYFAVLVLWRAAWVLSEGQSLADAVLAGAWIGTLALLCMGVLALIAWLMARSTVYSITTKRIVMRFGVGLPMTVNIPFNIVTSAALLTRADGSGDIPMTLEPGQRVSYLVMWPHVRPWVTRDPQPMLRAIVNPEAVAELLADQLAAPAMARRLASAQAPVAAAQQAPALSRPPRQMGSLHG